MPSLVMLVCVLSSQEPATGRRGCAQCRARVIVVIVISGTHVATEIVTEALMPQTTATPP
jgi:hypothetical protein